MPLDDVKFDIWKKAGIKYVYVRRFENGEDIGFVDIPLPDLETTLKRHPDWVVLGPAGEDIKVIHVSLSPDEEIIVCPLCDKSFATEKGLEVHKNRIHK